MARLTMERFMQLQEMGREPISLPAGIYFSGNEALQKTPGNHHLPKFRKTGTYNHPQVRAMRKREAMDMAKRLLNNTLTEITLRKVGGFDGLQKRLAEFGLTIDKDQMEVATMNANALEQDGNAKRNMREEQKRVELAKVGIAYSPIEEEKTPFPVSQQVQAVIRANTAKLSSADQLDSLKDDSERDGNNLEKTEEVEVGASTGVVETPEGDVEVNFVETN